MSLSKLPNELLLMIGDACESRRDFNALSRTNHFLYNLLNRHMYRNALRDNDGLLFLEALRDKKVDLVRRLVQESNTIQGFSWKKFCSIWYDGVTIRGTVRFLVAQEQNLDIHAPGPFNGQEILKSIIEESDAIGVDLLMEWKGDELLSDAEVLPHVYYAASHGDTRMIKTLLRHGFPIDFRGEKDRTALMIAAANGHVMAVKMLLEKGASVILTDKNYKLTALGWALRRGRSPGSIRLLIMFGSNPNLHDGHNRHLILTPLHLAFTAAVMPLLAGGARFDNDDDDHIPHFLFDFACQYGLDDVARWVYQRYPALVRTDHGSFPWYFLYHAVQSLSVKLVNQLLKWGANPNLRGPCDETPLNCAIKSDDVRGLLIVQDLLGHGANVNTVDALGTPLSLVLRFEKKRAVVYCKLFLEYGLDLRRHRWPLVAELLHLAVDANEIEMVKALHAQGVCLNTGVGRHAQPLIQAMSRGYVPIVNYLLRHGAQHDVANRHDQTVLSWAISNSHLETVEILLSMVNLVEHKDEIEAALVMAVLQGSDRVTQAIVDAGLDLPEDLVGLRYLFGSLIE